MRGVDKLLLLLERLHQITYGKKIRPELRAEDNVAWQKQSRFASGRDIPVEGTCK